MKCLVKLFLCLLFLPVSAYSSDDVIINEIMYFPSTAQSSQEFIEIYNRGSNDVSLLNWRFSRGVGFRFTNDIVLQPGAYHVVAANAGIFMARYPGVTNVSGNWVGSLANGGERVTLENALGDTIDTVRYADEGDWAVRQRGININGHRGWVWNALHDGQGSSVELVNQKLSNNNGQNWASSQVPGGTPGAVNSVNAGDTAPFILNTRHSPAIPSSADEVTVTAELVDQDQFLASATLFYRTGLAAFTPTVMADDGLHNDGLAGDGIFGGTIPPMPNNTVVEFYIQASDGDNQRFYPATAFDGGTPVQEANCLYQVDESVYAGDQPVHRFVLTQTEVNELFSCTIRQTDAQMNATLISTEGISTEIRYLCGIRIRGAGSRGCGNPVPNHRVNIPSDTLFNGVDAINLNSRWTHSQIMGSVLSLKAGLPAANARAVQVRFNAVNRAQAGSPQFGTYAELEVWNSDWAGNHFPRDSDGNIYRGSIGAHTADLGIEGQFPNNYRAAGYSKATNEAEDDWTDMQALTLALNTNANDTVYSREVQRNANVRMFMRYLGVFAILGSYETSLAIGRGDDWAAYRGVKDPRFILLPHDFDSIMGEGGGSTTFGLFRMMPAENGGANTPVWNRFMDHPDFIPIYYDELLRMIDTTFSAEEMEPLIDHYLEQWVPAQTIASMKQFMAARIAFIRSVIPQAYTAAAALPVQDGYFRATSSFISLNGQANAVETRRVLVGGVEATYNARQGSWFTLAFSVVPGINEILVQFLGEGGQEIHRETVLVWYDNGIVSDVSGVLGDSLTLDAAGSPFRFAGDVTVPAGLTLDVLPGTTIYMADNTRLIVEGRLNVAGTESQPVRFTRQPSSLTSWNGIVFNSSTDSNQIVHARIEFASGNDSVELNDSSLLIEHVVWAGTTGRILDMDNSSLIVRNSFFPATDGAETFHGTGMPTNGYVIVESNFFAGATGYSDIIDYTGGRRPGPILQIYHNTFQNATDDALDLDGTDAHIEGNIFIGAHQDQSRPSGSYAIATDTAADITVVRNVFYDVDHALLLKNDARATFQNNTVFQVFTNTFAAYDAAVISFGEPFRNVGGGAGIDLDGNIFWGIDGDRHLLFFTNGVMTLELDRSILSGTNYLDAGAGNLNLDPLFVNPDTNTITADSILADLALLPGSPARLSGPNGLDMGALVPGGASVSGEPLGTTPATEATLTVGGPGITHYRFSLNGASYGPETPIDTPIVLTGLASGTNQVAVIGKNSASVWQSESEATVSRAWIVDPAAISLVINEVFSRNDFLFVHEDTFPDVVELYNGGDAAVTLDGMGLTDDPTDPYRFKFPPGTSIAPGEYMVLFADNETMTSGIHLGFGLNQDGDSVHLFDRLANGGAELDSVVFGLQLSDRSIGRNVLGEWELNMPTPGAPNQRLPVGDPMALRINEWGVNGQTLFEDDFIELYNPQAVPVLLGGLHLTDTPIGWPARHRIAPLSYVGAFGHIAFLADGNTGPGADHVDFRLSTLQGEIALFDQDFNLIDCIIYGPQLTDVSEGFRPSGSDLRDRFGAVTQSQPTPGAPNPGLGGSVTITNITIPILPMATDWRYDRNGFLPAPDWNQPGYDDSGWLVGDALIGQEFSALPAPGLLTSLPNYNNDQASYYFRKTFVVATTNLTGFNLLLTTILDDGAIVYLNGSELLRIRMPVGPVNEFTEATTTVPDAAQEFWTLPSVTLPQGTNVLAVEVHQSSLPSSDIVWGAQIDAVRSVTNFTVFSIALNEIMANNVSVTVPGDTNITDWVEIHNPGASATDLSDMSLTDDVSQPRRFVFPPGTMVPGGGYLIVQFDSSRLPTTDVAAVPNTGFGLDSGGDEVFLFDAPSAEGTLIDSISFGLQAVDFTIGRIPNASGLWRLNLPTPGGMNISTAVGSPSNLKINEWMADPGSGDDYFEIYNPSPQPVELGGLFLTDDLANPFQYRIPDLSFIAEGLNGYAVFIADNNTGAGADHVNFRLSRNGELIAIFRPNGTTIDSVGFGLQEEDVSEGLFPDGTDNIVRFRGTATPGSSNILPLEDIVISEILTHTDPPLEDAVELQNVSPSYVDLSGWFLSDSKRDPKRYQIPPGTVLAPGEFMVFYEFQFNPDLDVPPSFSFSSSRGDNVVLSAADDNGDLTGFQAEARFPASENGVSFGRISTSVEVDYVAMEARTFGVDTPFTLPEFRQGTGLPNAAPKVGPIVISEVHYHPPDIVGPGATNDNVIHEFIELRNITASTVNLFDPVHPTNSWRLRDAVDYDFPAGLFMPPDSYLLVVSFDPVTNLTALADFRATFGLGTEVPIVGPYSGKLDNSDEDVELKKPDPPQPLGSPDAGVVPYIFVDRLKYRDNAPWPVIADGGGASLQRLDDTAFGNDPVNWTAGVPTPGAANVAQLGSAPVITTEPQDRQVSDGGFAGFSVIASGTELFYQWKYNGVDIPGKTNNVLSFPGSSVDDAGLYEVVVYNASGIARSRQANLTVESPPTIVKQPISRILAQGMTAVFTVAAKGSTPMSFQWLKDGVDIPGATDPSLGIPNAQVSDEGVYTAEVSNAFGTTTSDGASLFIEQPPTLTAQPTDQTVFVGETAQFSVSAVGTPPLQFQWRIDGAALPGQTNSTIAIANAQLSDAGDYTVQVLNSVGSVISDAATLTVEIPPMISIVATDALAGEPSGNDGAFLLIREGKADVEVLVDIAVSGDAIPGSDYTAIASPILIPVGVTNLTIPVTVLDDGFPEGNESVTVTLQPGAGYDIIQPDMATVLISDEDNQAPIASIVSPTENAIFTAPANISIEVVATDLDGSVALVEFFVNGTNKVGEVSAAPFVFNWQNAPAGLQLISAVVTDNLGSSGFAAPVTVFVNTLPSASITSPFTGSFFLVPGDITITASASDVDGVITQVELLEGTNILTVLTAEPYTYDWLGVPEGSYSLRARATDDQGGIALSAPVSITVGEQLPVFADDFADRGLILGFDNSLTATNSTYTKEPGEPNHAFVFGDKTAWISWTAPASDVCTMNTFGSDFDTAIAVYTGNAVDNLVEVASNDDSGVLLQSQVMFNAVAGTTYNVAVTGFGSFDFGVIQFSQSMPNPAPSITTQPTSKNVLQGSPVSFSVTATGAGPFNYQWRLDGAPIPGATQATLNIASAELSDAGSYTVEVSNFGGAVISDAAILTVIAPPEIITHPSSLLVNEGDPATFSVVASGTPPLVYQWRKNAANIPGATGSSLTVNAVNHADGGFYSVTVFNGAGSAISLAAELTVPPRITGSVREASGEFRFFYLGVPGKGYMVEMATDVATWIDLGPVTNTDVNGNYLDTSSAAEPSRFYRLRLID